MQKEKEKLLNEMDNIITEKNKIQEEIDKLNNEGNKEGNEQEIKRLEKQIAELNKHHIVLSNKLKEQRENLENKQKELDQVKEDKKRLEQEKNDAIEEKERFKVSYDNIFEEKKKIEEEIEKLRETNFTTTGNERYEENNRQEDEQKLQKLEKQEKELNRRLEILQELVKKKIDPKVCIEMTIKKLRGLFDNGEYMGKNKLEFGNYIDELEDWYNDNKSNDVDFNKKLNEIKFFVTDNNKI